MSRNIIAAGFWYCLIILIVGFLLGTIRVLVLVPRFGEVVAVAIEGPLILAASWFVCRRLIIKLHVSAEPSARWTMGAVAFGLLMMAEGALAIGFFGLSAFEHFQAYREPAHALGLAGQIAFGLFPWIQLKTAK